MADSKVSALPAATLPMLGTELVPVVQGGVSKQASLSDLRDPVPTVVVASNVANTSNTTAAVAVQAPLPVGTYNVKAWVVYQAAATTTGIEMWLNFTGTVTRIAATWYTLTTSNATTSTGIADQATTSAAQMMEGKAQRANNVAGGPMQGVDTASADQFAVVEGIVVVTVAGTLQLVFRSEVSGSAVTIMPGTNLDIRKVA
jgi:hypothetical protein